MEKEHVLCTGGAGYIGSHTVLKLLESNYRVTVLDNLNNSSKHVLTRLEEITNGKIPFINVDLKDKAAVLNLFETNKFDAVIHFAASKSIQESIENPLLYYENNVMGAINLLSAMKQSQCKILVFSSSATVYKLQAQHKLIKEEDQLQPTNPYGRTKLMIETILKDVHISDPSLKIHSLRYFNPIGAHSSGKIGEYAENPVNLVPTLQKVAMGSLPVLKVYGNDWDTPDKTGVRDYIHIEDLADGHVQSLGYLIKHSSGEYDVFNLGTGTGTSVLEMIQYFENASGKKIPYEFAARRPGDLPFCVADTSKANIRLNFNAKRTIQNGCDSAWKWQLQNPIGYA